MNMLISIEKNWVINWNLNMTNAAFAASVITATKEDLTVNLDGKCFTFLNYRRSSSLFQNHKDPVHTLNKP